MSTSVFPDSVIIVGAGIFGLSTALAIADRHPSTKVTIIDRATPPVEDGTSVDTTRCIRADYADPIYAKLAEEAQLKIEQDPDLSKYYFKQGMSFVTDGEAGPMLAIWSKGLVNIQRTGKRTDLVEMPDPESVFQFIHGKDSKLVPPGRLTGKRKWNRGYCNLNDAFIDARESIRVVYERCLAKSSLSFQTGTAVQKVLVEHGSAKGVLLEDGRQFHADLTLIAAGAWSNMLVYLEGMTKSSAIEVAWLKLTPEEIHRWKSMSITTNLSTGFNIFPPHNGEIKCLRRSAGLQYRARKSRIRGDFIPLGAEVALRDNLREIMPELADRPFDRTKLCWLSQTRSADFIIAPHPSIQGLHVATGGSAHSWKFLPIIGGYVVDSVLGILDNTLAAKWAWADKGPDGGSSPRIGGAAQELAQVVRSRL
ncbi:Fructosyl amino acid oxidasesarcosine oxidase [Penicillium chermesinum]|uniref:Fructosyl amino acid oxidasesarcosine oxidase n=1 Tax=Penicillium chermesinum TaxID=63820 RepID=A0A9W9NSH2_9EURO|nr:Fructosyl amino acid oxidasesarcosine oxidase [Penicillium chermesinum]KAJ5225345.1 Fructosyl amino acid oxidasesarcosine oxidase [Penicillium chermesinum]